MMRVQFAVTRMAFNVSEIAALRDLGDRDLSDGSSDYTGVSRNSRVCMMQPKDPEGWLFKKLWTILSQHNTQYYGYDLEYIQPLQYSVYDSATNGHYEWHQDWGSAVYNNKPEFCRKLSFSLQLSDPKEYEGGRLEINYGQDYAQESEQYLEQGTLISFPSWMLHRITPVTKGTRRSLVGWCMGVDFK